MAFIAFHWFTIAKLTLTWFLSLMQLYFYTAIAITIILIRSCWHRLRGGRLQGHHDLPFRLSTVAAKDAVHLWDVPPKCVPGRTRLHQHSPRTRRGSTRLRVHLRAVVPGAVHWEGPAVGGVDARRAKWWVGGKCRCRQDVARGSEAVQLHRRPVRPKVHRIVVFFTNKTCFC